MRLTKRMRAIADMCPPLESYADIGCDHGTVAAALVKENRAGKVIATDISEPSLKKAQRLAEEEGLCGSITFAVGDGLRPISGMGVGGAVICGMGGELITRILGADPDTLGSLKVLVLSPNKYPERLRAFLLSHGFRIETERLIWERDKYYPVMRAVKGREPEYTEEELYTGRHTAPDAEFLRWLEYMTNAWRRVGGSGAEHAAHMAGLYDRARERVLFALRDEL